MRIIDHPVDAYTGQHFNFKMKVPEFKPASQISSCSPIVMIHATCKYVIRYFIVYHNINYKIKKGERKIKRIEMLRNCSFSRKKMYESNVVIKAGIFVQKPTKFSIFQGVCYRGFHILIRFLFLLCLFNNFCSLL